MMKERLTHSEIDRIIDEQEREMDTLLHEDYSKEREVRRGNPHQGGLIGKFRRLWKRIFS